MEFHPRTPDDARLCAKRDRLLPGVPPWVVLFGGAAGLCAVVLLVALATSRPWPGGGPYLLLAACVGFVLLSWLHSLRRLVAGRRRLLLFLARHRDRAQDLRESQALQQAVVGSISDGMLLAFDSQQRFILAEGGGLVLLRLEAQDMVGKTAQDVFPQVGEELSAAMRSALEGKRTIMKAAVYDLVLEMDMLPLVDSGPDRAGVIIARDITRQQEAARELAMEKRRMSTLMASIPGMVYRCRDDERRTMVFVSEGVRRIAGYEPEELVGNTEPTWTDLVHEDDRAMLDAKIHASTGTGEPFEATYRITARSGQERWVKERGVVLAEEDGLVRMEGIVTDITARRTAELAARERERQLRRADRLATIGTLVTGVAHEINTPNTVVSLNTPLVAAVWKDAREQLEAVHAKGAFESLGGTPWPLIRDEVGPLLDKTMDASRRIRRIVSELKDFGRHGSGESMMPVDLTSVAKAAAGLVQSNIQRCTRHFVIEEPEEPIKVLGVFQRLEQVVVNALMNACEALNSPEQAVVMTCRKADGMAEIVVEDQGAGMSDEALKQAMNPFFTTKQGSGGTGLGLAIAQSIMEKHGGSIRLDSSPGNGTRCHIVLPLLDRCSVHVDAMCGRR